MLDFVMKKSQLKEVSTVRKKVNDNLQVDQNVRINVNDNK